MLGKRKEAHRRREMTFTVPFASGGDTTTSRRSDSDSGCATLREVVERVREFAARDPSVVIDVSGDGTNDDSEDEDERASGSGGPAKDGSYADSYAFFRIQSSTETTGDDASGAFQGRLEISNDSSVATTTTTTMTRGFEVTIAYEGGARSAFWKAADALKAATVRSGRQWRRRRLVEREDDARPEGATEAKQHL